MTTATIKTMASHNDPSIHLDRPLCKETRRDYKMWRTRIIYSVIIGYAAYYLLRGNFSLAMPGMMAELGYTKIQLGWVVTIWSVIYGVGKFINGFISDRSDARIFMSLGLFLSAVVCLFMGSVESLLMITVLWGASGWFQSMGWPPAARMVTHWYSPSELGMKWALCSSSHQVGGAIIAVLAGYLVVEYGWRSAFTIPAVIAIAISFFLYNRLRDRPQDLGFPPVEEYKGDVNHLKDEYEARVTAKEVLHQVLANKLVWYMGLANLCLYIPRMGIFVWAPTFLKEIKGTELTEAGWSLGAFEVAGLFGGIMAGWISDKVFGGRRGPVGVVFMVGLALAIALLWWIPKGYPVLDIIAMMLAGYLVYGPQILAGAASADFASKKAVGVANGFISTLAFLGSAISGVGIGKIVENYGWSGGFVLFIATSLVGAFFFMLVWNRRAKVLEDVA